MDTLTHSRELIKQIIQGHAHVNPEDREQLRVETIFDDTHDHYALVESGWLRGHRIEGQVIHVDLIGGKFWIQFDGTEYGVARELEDLGVPKQDIVLAFHSPAKRALTEYALG